MKESGEEQRPYYLGGTIWVSHEGLINLIDVNLRGAARLSRTGPKPIAYECLKKAGNLAEMAGLSLPPFFVEEVQRRIDSSSTVSAMHPYLDYLLVELSLGVINGKMSKQKSLEQYTHIRNYHLKPLLLPDQFMPSESVS